MNPAVPTLSLRSKLLYGLGYIPDVVMGNLIALLALMIYNVELGVSATLIGFAIALPRLWEAFTDPLIGRLSDGCRSRWGRRRPFLVVGAVAGGLLCMALWSPPAGLSTDGLYWWFLIVSVLYLTAYAAYNVPYQALGLEMATSDRDRASLAGFRAAANNLSWIIILPVVPKLVTNGWLGDNLVDSVQVVGVLVGILIIVLGVTAAVTCKEPAPSASTGPHDQGPGLIAGISMVFCDRAFLMVAGIQCFALIGFVLAMTVP
jgi:GPH family glycoside/pentoside/hexuronide:cation symporter